MSEAVHEEPFMLHGVLYLHGKVKGKMDQSGKLPTLEEYVKMYEPVHGQGIGGIQLGHVSVGDEDVPDIYALAKTILSAHPDQKKIGYIDVSCTCIKTPTFFEAMMQVAHTVNITNTTAFSISNKMFYNSQWFRDHLGRFIFVPKMWIEGQGWKTMFSPKLEPHQVELVKQTAKDFYFLTENL